eukprot:714953-Rhodomonas_salina.1
MSRSVQGENRGSGEPEDGIERTSLPNITRGVPIRYASTGLRLGKTAPCAMPVPDSAYLGQVASAAARTPLRSLQTAYAFSVPHIPYPANSILSTAYANFCDKKGLKRQSRRRRDCLEVLGDKGYASLHVLVEELRQLHLFALHLYRACYTAQYLAVVDPRHDVRRPSGTTIPHVSTRHFVGQYLTFSSVYEGQYWTLWSASAAR